MRVAVSDTEQVQHIVVQITGTRSCGEDRVDVRASEMDLRLTRFVYRF